MYILLALQVTILSKSLGRWAVITNLINWLDNVYLENIDIIVSSEENLGCFKHLTDIHDWMILREEADAGTNFLNSWPLCDKLLCIVLYIVTYCKLKTVIKFDHFGPQELILGILCLPSPQPISSTPKNIYVLPSPYTQIEIFAPNQLDLY